MREPQHVKVQRYMEQHGPITSITAIGMFGITRLADVVYQLRAKGLIVNVEKKQGFHGGTYAEYSIGE
jgi:hypothetical protein